MSTRWYPIYQRGNPQLRVFLPNFWMRIVRPKNKSPANTFQVECSMQMTKFDIRNYLEKIYKIPVVEVHTFIRQGNFRKALGANYIVKDDDIRMAAITLPPKENFEFPNLFPEREGEDEIEEHRKQAKTMQADWKYNSKKISNRPGIPTWFGI